MGGLGLLWVGWLLLLVGSFVQVMALAVRLVLEGQRLLMADLVAVVVVVHLDQRMTVAGLHFD